jgi:hypothetical protein
LCSYAQCNVERRRRLHCQRTQARAIDPLQGRAGFGHGRALPGGTAIEQQDQIAPAASPSWALRTAKVSGTQSAGSTAMPSSSASSRASASAGVARLHLAAGKLPQAAMVLAQGPLLKQQARLGAFPAHKRPATTRSGNAALAGTTGERVDDIG